MTIKDGFKLGIGLALAQLFIIVLVTVLSIPILYVVGTTVKTAVINSLINSSQGDK